MTNANQDLNLPVVTDQCLHQYKKFNIIVYQKGDCWCRNYYSPINWHGDNIKQYHFLFLYR